MYISTTIFDRNFIWYVATTDSQTGDARNKQLPSRNNLQTTVTET